MAAPIHPVDDDFETIELPDIRHHRPHGNPAQVHPYAPERYMLDDELDRRAIDAMSPEEVRALFRARMEAMRAGEADRALRRDAMLEQIMLPQVEARMQHLEIERALDRIAERQAQLRQCCTRYSAAVVATLLILAGVIAQILSETGSDKPNKGEGFQDSSARLRDDAAVKLLNASPTYWCWSGAAAAHYQGKVGEQQTQMTSIAEADLQAATAVAHQADQVEQARSTLEATLVALAGGIAAAKVLEAGWKAAIAAGSPTAPALGVMLVTLGVSCALAAIAAASAVLIEMHETGKRTRAALATVTDTYRSIADGASITAPIS